MPSERLRAVKFCHCEELATKQSGECYEMALSLTLHAMTTFYENVTALGGWEGT